MRINLLVPAAFVVLSVAPLPAAAKCDGCVVAAVQTAQMAITQAISASTASTGRRMLPNRSLFAAEVQRPLRTSRRGTESGRQLRRAGHDPRLPSYGPRLQAEPRPHASLWNSPLIGVSGQSVYKWESGEVRPRRAQLEGLAKPFALKRRGWPPSSSTGAAVVTTARPVLRESRLTVLCRASTWRFKAAICDR